jgi:6-phosphogluconolactonase
MSSEAQVIVEVHNDVDELARAAATGIVTRLVDAQAARGQAAIVLTGGRSGDAVHRALREHPDRDTVDWRQVDVWWGDERFLPSGDPERNVTQARAALLDALDLDPARVHPMPASDGPDGPDPEAAAARYARELSEAVRPGRLPYFDVLMLGVGEDGHVASIFPGHPGVDQARPVSAVRDSPKPPPTRITLTLPTLNRAAEVWLMATGAGKAQAVGTALAGSSSPPPPAAEVTGMERTVWLLDRAAATEVPAA